MKFLTIPKFAKSRGVSTYTIQRAVQDGRISTIESPDGRKLIDPEKADVEWEANTDPKRRGSLRKKKARGPDPSDDEKADETIESLAKEDQELREGKTPPFAASRALREAYAAKLARLEYEERSNALVDAEKVQKEAMKAGRIVRDAILNVPARISADLASETDPLKLEKKLREELIAALRDLADETLRP